MFLTCHMLVGAGIGKALQRPALACPAAYLSHYVLDAVPHLDGGGLFNVVGPPTLAVKVLGVADLAIGAVVVWWLIRGRPLSRTMGWAAFCAILVDIIDYVPPWCEWVHHCKWISWYSFAHDLYSHGMMRDQWLPGFGTQIVTAFLGAWFITRTPRALTCSVTSLQADDACLTSPSADHTVAPPPPPRTPQDPAPSPQSRR